MLTLKQRQDAGRAARQHLKRRDLRAVGNLERDPVSLLEQSSLGRVERLVPLRYGRMGVSPFTFFRGSAIIQARDLSTAPDTGQIIPICGDAHLMNFGGFATPERQQVFDVNDFDEVSSGPWDWDLKRLCASLMVAGEHLRHGKTFSQELAYLASIAYRDRMASYVEYGALDLWYETISMQKMLESSVDPEHRDRIRLAMTRAAKRSHENMLTKLATYEDGRWQIRDVPPSLFHVHGAATLFSEDDDWMKAEDWQEAITRSFTSYLNTIAPERRELLRKFHFNDIVFKVVGVGSVGTRCMVMLMTDAHGKPLFLQIKEARQSVVATFRKTAAVKNEGERVVNGQRLMQAASDIFLGWFKGKMGRCFYVRQLRDMKLTPQVELFDASLMAGYAKLCGWTLARAHAKAGGCAPEISGYLGSSDQFADAMVNYSTRYAEQVNRDYDKFIAACRSGRLVARTDDEMALDFRV